MRLLPILLSLLYCTAKGFGQEQPLTLNQAIANAIANNRSIKVQQMRTEMATNNAFKANAGKGLVINGLGSFSYQNTFADVKLRTFQQEPEFIQIEESGVESWNANAGVQADYVLYDGGRSTLRYQLLQDQSKLASAQQEVLINETVLAAAHLYLEILKLQRQAQFLQDNIEQSKARLQKMEDRKQFGQASSLDLLRLQTALNEDEAALDEVVLLKGNLSKDLNFVMGQPVEKTYQVEQIEEEVSVPDLIAVNKDVLNNNPELLISTLAVGLASNQLTLNKIDRLPTVNTFANAGLFYQNNDVQQLARIQTFGVTIGFNARYNLFDGGVRKNRIQNAKISIDIENTNRKALEENLISQAHKERSSLILLQAQIDRAERNLETFEAAQMKAQDLFSTGKVSLLEVRDAQLARLNALLRIDQLKTDQLKSILQLKKLRGILVN